MSLNKPPASRHHTLNQHVLCRLECRDIQHLPSAHRIPCFPFCVAVVCVCVCVSDGVSMKKEFKTGPLNLALK